MYTRTQDIISSIQDRLVEIDRMLEELPSEREMLVEMLKQVPNQSQKPKVGPTEGVMLVLRERPGLTALQIISRLEGQVATKSKEVRKILDQTIRNLHDRGVIAQNSQGGYVLTKR